MKIIIPLILLINISCLSKKNSNNFKDDFFEGVITYNIEYKSINEGSTSERLKKIIGSKMILTFKNGNYKKEYFSPEGKLLSFRILNLTKNKSFLKMYDIDTLYWFDITKNDSKTTFIKHKDSTILDHITTGVKTKTTLRMDSYPNRTYECGGEYYFAKDLSVNPKWYKNYKEGNLNEIIKIGKGIQLLFINDSESWTQTITAIKIDKQKISNNKIKIKLSDYSILKEL